MLERFTVDMVADHVATQMLEGDPSPKLAHRFFRKGRRDGRHAFDHLSIRMLVRDAVNLASSELSEEFVRVRHELESRRQELILQERHFLEQAEPPSEAPSTDPEPVQDPAPATDTGASSDEILVNALRNRYRLRNQAAARQRRDEERQSRDSADQARSAAADAALAARREIATLETRLDQLATEFLQRFETIAHTGQLLWSRYCNGFEQGKERRGSRESDVQAPDDLLEFPVPQSLRPYHEPSRPMAVRPTS